MRSWRARYRATDTGGPPRRAGRCVLTLAGVARRTLAGEDFQLAVREFLDEFALRPGAQRVEALAEEPPPTGDRRFDAMLAALAEHLSLREDLPAPGWCTGSTRFLDRFWFVSTTPGFRAVSLAQAPAAFKRRGALLPERSLLRV